MATRIPEPRPNARKRRIVNSRNDMAAMFDSIPSVDDAADDDGRNTSATRDSDGSANISEVFREHGMSGLIVYLLDIVDSHQWAFFVAGVIFILIGVTVNRYFSVLMAALMLGIGYLSESQETERDSMMIYIASIITFIVPFLY